MTAARVQVRLASAVLALASTAFATGSPAAAQFPEPLGPFAIDVHGLFVNFGDEPEIAAAHELETGALPGRGLGLDVGAHVYFGPPANVRFGLGASVLTSSGRREPNGDTGQQATGRRVETRFRTVSPQLSINFGSEQGWSYLSGGVGFSEFRLTGGDPGPLLREHRRLRTLNYGGGARWFTSRHAAFSLDLRFYAIGSAPGTATTPPLPRMTLMVFGAGVSFR